MSRIIGSSLFVLSLVTTFFLTPEDFKKEYIWMNIVDDGIDSTLDVHHSIEIDSKKNEGLLLKLEAPKDYKKEFENKPLENVEIKYTNKNIKTIIHQKDEKNSIGISC